MEKISVLIADTNGMVRRGIRKVLTEQPDMVVIGETAEGQEALSRVKLLLPDVTLLDMALPPFGGLETLRMIRQSGSATQVIILSIHKKEAYVCQAIEDGARGYVVKPALTPGVVDAIRLVHDNGYFLGSGVNYESVRLLVQKKKSGKPLRYPGTPFFFSNTPARHPA